MSFGVSTGDVFLVIQFVNKTYQKWKEAPSEYADVARLLRSNRDVLKEVCDLIKGETFQRGERARLRRLLRDVEGTVGGLDDLVEKFRSLRSFRRINWDRLRWGTKKDEVCR